MPIFIPILNISQVKSNVLNYSDIHFELDSVGSDTEYGKV